MVKIIFSQHHKKIQASLLQHSTSIQALQKTIQKTLNWVNQADVLFDFFTERMHHLYRLLHSSQTNLKFFIEKGGNFELLKNLNECNEQQLTRALHNN